jgi:hypothetical protein
VLGVEKATRRVIELIDAEDPAVALRAALALLVGQAAGGLPYPWPLHALTAPPARSAALSRRSGVSGEKESTSEQAKGNASDADNDEPAERDLPAISEAATPPPGREPAEDKRPNTRRNHQHPPAPDKRAGHREHESDNKKRKN